VTDHSLLGNAVVYLTAAVVCVPLAKRLRLGSVLGYLIAGILIGPWGFRLVTNVEDILHFSEFGVVLMLFLIGLELDPRRLWALRRAIFGAGSAQIAACGAILAAGALVLGLPWQAALIAGLALALSSTAIAVQSLNERNLLPTPLGQAGFSILLFQDLAAIPMIALVPLLGMRGAAAHGSGWVGVARVIGVVVAIIILGRFLVRPALRQIAKTEMREIFTAFALLLVIGIALVVQAVGLSMALGTFLAGVLLAESEYRRALEVDLEPFKGLLLGLFFIAVGMSIDFGVLARQPGVVLALVAAFLLAKTVMLSGLAGPIGIAPPQRWLFAFLLAQGGEFAFVVFGAAAAAGVFAGTLASTLILVVALSMATTPLFLLFHDTLLAPRYAAATQRSADVIDSPASPVIIAGFGRFGQIVGRLLFANGIAATVLDHDPDQIELLRRFGFKVFYGDATRLDLLEAAGARTARVLVVAIDNVEDSVELVDIARTHFPQLTILARARNVAHYFELLEREVASVERETFESALLLGRRVLQANGLGAHEARVAADRFRRHNIASLRQVLPHRRDQAKLVSLAKQARADLEALFERDREDLERRQAEGW
jgi:glutathione-regulated potassium-efflux system ancillary protein KefC